MKKTVKLKDLVTAIKCQTAIQFFQTMDSGVNEYLEQRYPNGPDDVNKETGEIIDLVITLLESIRNGTMEVLDILPKYDYEIGEDLIEIEVTERANETYTTLQQ